MNKDPATDEPYVGIGVGVNRCDKGLEITKVAHMQEDRFYMYNNTEREWESFADSNLMGCVIINIQHGDGWRSVADCSNDEIIDFFRGEEGLKNKSFMILDKNGNKKCVTYDDKVAPSVFCASGGGLHEMSTIIEGRANLHTKAFVGVANKVADTLSFDTPDSSLTSASAATHVVLTLS